MRPSAFIKFPIGLLSLITAVGLPGANLSTEDPWITETVRGAFSFPDRQGSGTPSDPLGGDQRNSPFFFPRLPTEAVPEQKWEEFVLESTRWNTAALEDMGVSLPPGTLFLWDSHSSTLAVHTRSSALPEIRRRARRSLSSAPETISFRATALEGSRALLLPIVEGTYTSSNHSEASNRLDTLMAEGKIQPVNEFRAETRAGQRVTARSSTSSWETGSVQQSSAIIQQRTTEEYLSGLHLELEPATTLVSDKVEASLSLTVANMPPTRSQKVLENPNGAEVTIPVVNHHDTCVAGSTLFVSGVPRIIAAWTPQYEGRPADADKLRLLVVEANVLPVLPPETPQLKEKLARLADKLKDRNTKTIALPVAKSEPASLPPGMESRSIKVSAAFLKEQPQEQLRRADIPMPDGSECTFHAASRSLIAVNTPENLDAIQALVSSPQFQDQPLIRHTLYILQGDGPTLRQWTKEITNAADPTAKWKELLALTSAKPKLAKVLEVAQAEVQSGKRVTLANATDHMISGPPGQSSDSTNAKESSTKSAVQSAQAFEIQLRKVGLVIEAESIADAEGRTIDCNLKLEYDYAPPTFAPGDLPPRQEQFHRARLVTSRVMLSGIPQVLGQWVPLNLPEASGKDMLQIAVLRVDPIWIPESGE